MKVVSSLLSFTLVCFSINAQSSPDWKNAKPQPLKLVVLGDSLSAGVENFSLVDRAQKHGYANVIAKQAGWPLTLPLVPYPGFPNELHVVTLGPPVDIEPVSGPLPALREDPWVQPTDIAVPGLMVGTALTLRPIENPVTDEDVWAKIVLGYPNLPERAPTEIELAKWLKPQLLIEWIGNDDALVPALSGAIAGLTPTDQFKTDYIEILQELEKTNATIVTATIPDVTEIPFFVSAQTLADETGLKLDVITTVLGIHREDYVRLSAQIYIDAILTGAMPGPLPKMCPAPLPDLGSSTLPCVLTKADAMKIRGTLNCYNKIIKRETRRYGGVVVDIHALVDRIYTKGYPIGSETLTADFFGGLFSLDGIHPDDTGYGVIANEFIKVMNGELGTTIPPANIESIFAADPLTVYAKPNYVSRPLPENPGDSCAVEPGND